MSRRLTFAAVGMLAVTLIQPVAGQNTPIAGSQRGQSSSQPAPGAYASAIKVHGHWTVVVRNRDGSVASTREFENSIAGGGSSFFSHLMARAMPQFYWGVSLKTLCGTAPALTPCLIAEPASAGDTAISNFYKGAVTSNLTISAPTSGPNAYRFVLSGSLTSPNTGQITDVSTIAVAQNGTSDNMSGVTETNLQQPIAVQAGQIVDVTVVISFS